MADTLRSIFREAMPSVVSGLLVPIVLALAKFVLRDIWLGIFASFAVIWLAALYTAVAKQRGSHFGKATQKQAWKYTTKYRTPAIVLLLVVPALAIVLASWEKHQKDQLEEKIVIVLADFDGPEPKQYRVTELVRNALDSFASDYDDVVVVGLGYPINQTDGWNTIAKVGNQYSADMIIWGGTVLHLMVQ